MLAEMFGKPAFHGFKKLTDRVYVYFSYVNSTVVLADDGVCIIDSQVNSGQVRKLMAEIRNLTSLPVKWVINTHYHWDHVIGNRFFKEQGATIYGGELTRHLLQSRMRRQWAFLKGRGFTMEDPEPTLPDVTFEGEMNLNLAGITLQLRHFGPTESDDATAIVLPREQLVCTGDTLLTGSFPIFGMAVMNEGLREDRKWLQTIDRIRALRSRNLIPGHGPLGTEADLDLMARVQTYFLDSVEHYVNQGLSLPEMEKKIRGDLPDDIRKLPEVWGTVGYAIYRAYHSFTGWMDYKPSAIPELSPEAFQAEVKACENDTGRMVERAEQALGKSDYATAVSLTREIVHRDPEDADAHARFAETLIEAARTTSSILEKGDFFSLAKQHLDEALEHDPQNALALLVKGMFFIVRAEKNGTDPMEGVHFLERAAAGKGLTARRQAKVQFGLALGYMQSGKREQAVQASLKATQLDPTYFPAQKLADDMAQQMRPART